MLWLPGTGNAYAFVSFHEATSCHILALPLDTWQLYPLPFSGTLNGSQCCYCMVSVPLVLQFSSSLQVSRILSDADGIQHPILVKPDPKKEMLIPSAPPHHCLFINPTAAIFWMQHLHKLSKMIFMFSFRALTKALNTRGLRNRSLWDPTRKTCTP